MDGLCADWRCLDLIGLTTDAESARTVAVSSRGKINTMATDHSSALRYTMEFTQRHSVILLPGSMSRLF